MIVSAPSVGFLELELEGDPVAEGRAWRARAREFADELVRPVGQVLDRMDSQAAVAPGSPLFDLLAQAHREGFTRLTDSPDEGGIGLSRDAEYPVLEELAAADAGLAAVLIGAPLPFRWARAAGGERLAATMSTPYFTLAHTDWSGCCSAAGPPGRVRATRDGDGWLLAGATTPLVPAAAVATHAALACTLEGGHHDRHALALVPLDRPGVSRGPALDQLGLRTQARAQLLLDAVQLSADELLVQPSGAAGTARALAHASTALVAVGIGRAAYEGTLRLARERLRDGARRRLFRMSTLLEAARGIARAVHVYAGGRADAGESCSVQQAAAAHAFAAEAAFELADAAMELCAGRTNHNGGVEYLDGSTFHPEKLLRDAQSIKVARPAGTRPAPLAPAYH